MRASGILHTLLLAIILAVCFAAFFFLMIMMVLMSDPGIDAKIMAWELVLATCSLAITSGALYSIYRWCLTLFLLAGSTHQDLFRTWAGMLFTCLFVVIAVFMFYHPLGFGLSGIERPGPSRLIPILLNLGWLIECAAVVGAACWVVRAWYRARNVGPDLIVSEDMPRPKWLPSRN